MSLEHLVRRLTHVWMAYNLLKTMRSRIIRQIPVIHLN